MMKYLAVTLICYLVIGVVYALVKIVREASKRYRVLDSDGCFKWLDGMNHLDEFDISAIADDDHWSGYFWYIRLTSKLNNVNKILGDVVYILTWPIAVPLFIEVVAKALDAIYESRFGEED